jgi:Protein of unknown function (DUF2167)
MKLMLIAYALSVMFGLLMVVRVWRASTLDGVLTLLVPFYFIIAMIKYWNEPDHNIRFHALGMVVCLGIAFWAAFNAAEKMVNSGVAGMLASGSPAERADVVRQLREEGISVSAEEEKALTGNDPEAAARTMQHILATMESRQGGTSGSAEAHAAARPRDAEFDNPRPVAAEERPPEVLSYAEAARRATFNRGRYTREAIGLTVDLPLKYRLINAADARRLDQSRGRPEDARVMGWVLDEKNPLADPDTWHVTMRWHPDGWIAAGTLDPVQLLQAAQSQREPTVRVAASNGDLLGYAVSPQFDGQVLDWSEERVLANSDTHVVDCHAVRPGLRGMIEFSISGMAPAALETCHATVRLMAEKSSFHDGKGYVTTAPEGVSHASYTLAGVASHSP